MDDYQLGTIVPNPKPLRPQKSTAVDSTSRYDGIDNREP